MSLTYTLDWAAFQISKDSKGENAFVRKRIKKLCKDILALKVYVANLPVHKDFVEIPSTLEEYRKMSYVRRYCAACRMDITFTGGWQFPQEPNKFYCTKCEGERFFKNLESKRKKVIKDES